MWSLIQYYLLSTYHVPSSILSTEDRVVNKKNKNLCRHGANILVPGSRYENTMKVLSD